MNVLRSATVHTTERPKARLQRHDLILHSSAHSHLDALLLSYLIFILASHSSSHIVPLCIHRLGRIRDIQLSSCSLSSLSFFPDPFRAAAAQPSMPPSKGSGSPIWGRVRRPRQRRQPQHARVVARRPQLSAPASASLHLSMYLSHGSASAGPAPSARVVLHVTRYALLLLNRQPSSPSAQYIHQHPVPYQHPSTTTIFYITIYLRSRCCFSILRLVLCRALPCILP